MTAVCTHARCLGSPGPDGTWQDCDWTPLVDSKRGTDVQAEAHVKAARHGVRTNTYPADQCKEAHP